MAREPDIALFKTASGLQKIVANFFYSIVRQRISPERHSKVTTGVVFSFHIARLVN